MAHRTSQGETQEVREALQHLKDPEVQEERERHLEALSAAQGGRWLDEGTVRHEPEGGYGKQYHHVSQAQSPEVKEVLAARHAPGYVEADEKLREARAAAQGGRWMDEGNMPRALPTQADQPEVKEALAHAASPEVKEAMERKAAARAAAQGGRWLD